MKVLAGCPSVGRFLATAVAAAGGILALAAPAAAVSSLTTASPAMRAAHSAVTSCTMPGSAPAGRSRIGLSCRDLRAIAHLIAPSTGPVRRPAGTSASTGAGRRWTVVAGALVIGGAIYLGVAQWQLKPRRRK